MSKGIELTQSQIKAFENGATTFLFPCTVKMKGSDDLLRDYKFRLQHGEQHFINDFAPIQKGDKDIFIKENKTICDECCEIVTEFQNDCYCHAGKIINNIRIIGKFKECVDVKCVKVQDLTYEDIENLGISVEHKGIKHPLQELYEEVRRVYNNQMQERGLNRTYEDNDYVFLAERKR